MEHVMYDRFVANLNEEIKRLGNENGINPISTVTDDLGCSYVYSLLSLNYVSSSLTFFADDLNKRRDEKKTEALFELDKEKSLSLPCEVAFSLRGYLGVISEDSFIVDGDKELELQNLLKGWFSVNMVNGEEQDKLSEFLFNCENNYIEDFYLDNDDFVQKSGFSDKNKFVEKQVKKKLGKFREIMMVSSSIVKDMFLDVWKEYSENLAIREKKKVDMKEYINAVVVEELQKMKDELESFVKGQIDNKFTVVGKEYIDLATAEKFFREVADLNSSERKDFINRANEISYKYDEVFRALKHMRQEMYNHLNYANGEINLLINLLGMALGILKGVGGNRYGDWIELEHVHSDMKQKRILVVK